MKKYKFKMIRTNIFGAATDELESLANKYSRDGWTFKTMLFFKDISTFMMIFDKDIDEKE